MGCSSCISTRRSARESLVRSCVVPSACLNASQVRGSSCLSPLRTAQAPLIMRICSSWCGERLSEVILPPTSAPIRLPSPASDGLVTLDRFGLFKERCFLEP